jgi:uncharacterized protein
MARIEVGPDEISRLMETGMRQHISSYLHQLGFDYVTVDMDGYQTGSMNRTLPK